MHFFLFLSHVFFSFILVSYDSAVITLGTVGAKTQRIRPSSRIPPFKIKFSTVNKSCPCECLSIPLHPLWSQYQKGEV